MTLTTPFGFIQVFLGSTFYPLAGSTQLIGDFRENNYKIIDPILS